MKIENGLDPTARLQSGKIVVVHEKRIGFKIPDRPPSLFPSKGLFPSKTLYPYKEV